MPWMEIKTQFIKDRMARTSWENRKYIRDLRSIERTILSGGPKSSVAANMHWVQKTKYPVEAECIEKEIRDGIYVSPKEFQELEDKWKREKRVKAEQAERERKAEEDVEWRLWLKLGGRP